MRKLAFIFPLLFIFELIFGISGTMIVVHGIAIRHILFILSFISLYGYVLFYILKNKKKIFSLQKDAFLGSFTKIDIGAVVFELSMILSMTVIPFIMGTSLRYAKSEVFDSAAIFSLFFAVSYLIKENQIDVKKILSCLKVLVFLFAVYHLILYFGQEMQTGFIEDVFKAFNELVGGNGLVPRIVLGHGGYTRGMFNTSIYLLIGFFIFFYEFKKNKWYDYLIFIVELLAMITTVTKSIWFGTGIAFALACAAYLAYGLKTDRRMAVKAVSLVIITGLTIVISDKLIFNDIVYIRMSNAFVTTVDEDETEESEDSDKEENRKKKAAKKLDEEGAAESNSIKIEQMGKLLEKWKGSPIIGYGYGSYVEGYLRSEVAPFSYEMQLFSLLMKIGILGLIIWIGFFALQFIVMIKKKSHNLVHIFAWLFLLMALVVCVQTNPLLISFTGMSVILFLSLISIDESNKF